MIIYGTNDIAYREKFVKMSQFYGCWLIYGWLFLEIW